MYVGLTMGMNDEAKHNFVAQWRNSQNVRLVLSEYFSTQLEKSIVEEEDVTTLADPNWQLRQAHALGLREAYREIIRYLDQKAD